MYKKKRNVNFVEGVVVWQKQNHKNYFTENYVAGFRIVAMVLVIVQNRVHLVLQIVDRVFHHRPHHHQPIVVIGFVMVEKRVHHVLLIVGHVKY